MNKGKNIWVSQAVVDYLESMLGDREGGGVFDRESYNQILLELFELAPYTREYETKYDVSMLNVGEQQVFIIESKSNYYHARRVIKRIGDRVGREFATIYYDDASRMVATRIM